MNISIYQPKFKIGETVEYDDYSDYVITYPCVIISSHFQLSYISDRGRHSDYDDRSSDYVLYSVFNITKNCLDWLRETHCHQFCTNTIRGKKILLQHIKRIEDIHHISQFVKFKNMVLEGDMDVAGFIDYLNSENIPNEY